MSSNNRGNTINKIIESEPNVSTDLLVKKLGLFSKARKSEYFAKKVRRTLQQVEDEQFHLAAKVRGILAKNQSFRKKDFDLVMKDIWERQNYQRERILEAVNNLRTIDDRVVNLFKELEVNYINYESLSSLSNELHLCQSIRKKFIQQLILLIQKTYFEHEQLIFGLKRLLAKGPLFKIRDLKVTLKGLHFYYNYDEVSNLLFDLTKLQELTVYSWHGIDWS